MSINETLEILSRITRDDPLFWTLPTTINCNIVRSVGLGLCLAAFAGIILNGSLLLSFVRYKALRTPPNIFIMFMSAVGLLAACVNIPMSGSSSVFCRWLYSRGGCYTEGLVAFLYGCASCYLLCAVSLSRCYIIVRPFDAKSVTVTKCVIISVVAVVISLVITFMPIFGWNEYTLEGARTSCCTNLYDRRSSFVSFNLFIFVVVYCIPLIVLVGSNTTIYVGLKSMQKKVEHGMKTELSNKRIEMERRILKSIVMTVAGFIFSWTPYAVTFFITAFSSNNYRTPPVAIFMCSCFAKTSVMWIPFLYMSTSTQFRLSIVDQNAVTKATAGGATTVVGEGTNVATTAQKK